jgi:Putative oxalocrotonate tautomerase enzyme
MPLWRIYSHPTTFTPSQREGIAKSITDLYVAVGLPAFYVNVLFIDLSDHGSYVSGAPTKAFVRVTVEQIARALPSPDTAEGAKRRTGWMDKINGVNSRRGESKYDVLTRTGTQTMDPGPRGVEVGNSYQRDSKRFVEDPRH